MLLKEWEKIFRPNVVKKKSENFSVTEIDRNDKFEMELRLVLNDNSTYYHLFIEHNSEKSRLTHCKVQSFPDIIIFEIDSNQSPIFHIIELKKTPGTFKNMKKISRQFLSGYIHILSSLYFLDYNKSKTPEYKYYVGYVNEVPQGDINSVYEGIEVINYKFLSGVDLHQVTKTQKIRTFNECKFDWHKNFIIFDDFCTNDPETVKKFENIQKLKFSSDTDKQGEFSYYKCELSL